MANRWLGERVTPLQWTGLLLGLAGVVLILHNRTMSGDAGWGWLASGVSLVSITLGTLYQKRYCGRIDWRAGNLVQYIAVAIFFGAAAWLFENNVVHWTAEFVLALVWLAVVLSIGSIGLLYWLIRRSAATSVASLFYLVPTVTAVMAYVLFGERLDTVAIVGMVACAAAVFLVNRREARRLKPNAGCRVVLPGARNRREGDRRETICHSLSGDVDRPDPDRFPVSGHRRQGLFQLAGRRHARRNQAAARDPVLSAVCRRAF